MFINPSVSKTSFPFTQHHSPSVSFYLPFSIKPPLSYHLTLFAINFVLFILQCQTPPFLSLGIISYQFCFIHHSVLSYHLTSFPINFVLFTLQYQTPPFLSLDIIHHKFCTIHHSVPQPSFPITCHNSTSILFYSPSCTTTLLCYQLTSFPFNFVWFTLQYYNHPFLALAIISFSYSS